jgi:hypothetical protein
MKYKKKQMLKKTRLVSSSYEVEKAVHEKQIAITELLLS